ncbi:hypothetical protein WG66_005594 [Moniliophthora roreri]|nr:hypothetical protein WG66_005594 [Moniliophthora roreri]
MQLEFSIVGPGLEALQERSRSPFFSNGQAGVFIYIKFERIRHPLQIGKVYYIRIRALGNSRSGCKSSIQPA